MKELFKPTRSKIIVAAAIALYPLLLFPGLFLSSFVYKFEGPWLHPILEYSFKIPYLPVYWLMNWPDPTYFRVVRLVVVLPFWWYLLASVIVFVFEVLRGRNNA